MTDVLDCNFEKDDYSHYTPDLDPSDYPLFAKIKKKTKYQKHLASNLKDEDIIFAFNDFLKEQDNGFFTNGIQGLQQH